VQYAIDVSHLLIITTLESSVTSVSAQRTVWCSQYVLDIADEIVIGGLAPDGMLACLLADLRHDKPIRLPME